MKALIKITEENERELLRYHFANEETTKLMGVSADSFDFVEATHLTQSEFLEVEITFDQLNFKPRKKREGE